MDIGKPRLPIAEVSSGDTAADLQTTFVSLGILKRELAILPGFADIEVTVTIAAGQAVNINNGKLRLADAATSLAAIGICVKGAIAGQKARIMLGMGFASGLVGLTANSSVYLGNAGALLYVKPGAGFIQGLGFTLSTTEMFVTISQP